MCGPVAFAPLRARRAAALQPDTLCRSLVPAHPGGEDGPTRAIVFTTLRESVQAIVQRLQASAPAIKPR